MLEKILAKYTVEDAIELEFNDRQFLAYKKLYEADIFSDVDYLFLIIQNALISYQLSGKGEDYHEEFCFNIEREVGSLNGKKLNETDFYRIFEKFLKNCKNNKRLINMKLKRIEKVSKFYTQFSKNIEFYYKNMDKLASDLAKIMGQKKDAKTIVFAVKLFSYGARNVFGYVEKFPSSLMIPIDSRLENLYKLDTKTKEYTLNDVKLFYKRLAEKVNIPLLHLDAILWIKYNELVNLLK